MAIIGANIPPIRPHVEHKPAAALLAGVGNKSNVNEYTTEVTHDIKSFPIMENVSRSAAGSKKVDKFSVS